MFVSFDVLSQKSSTSYVVVMWSLPMPSPPIFLQLPLLLLKTTSLTFLRTIRMPHLTRKPHRRRGQRIIFRKLQLCWEYASFKWRALWSLYQCFPDEEVVFADWAGVDAVGGVVGEVFVFLEEAF